MRVYKATYKDREGKKQKSQKWYIDIFDHNQLRHKIPAFKDKRLSEGLGRNIESLVNCRSAGLELDIKLNQWLETIPDNLLKKFVSWGLIEGQRKEFTKPLTEVIEDYVKYLEAKSFSKGYIRHTQNRLNKIVKDCRFFYFRDITKTATEIYIGKLSKEGLSSTTVGHYLDCLKTFLNWAEQDQRINRNPLVGINKPARHSEKKGILTPEQFIELIKITSEKNIIIERTTGQERAVLYLLAGLTGLRKKELFSLCWDDINLSDDSAFVRVRMSVAKNKKEAEQPVPPILVHVLKALKAHVKPELSDRVFASFKIWMNTADFIREDLKVAKIELADREGNEICFHSLRNSYISFLANSMTPVKTVQKLARHSDPRLTFNTYARTFADSEQQAMNFLPDFGNFVLSTCLDSKRKKQEIYVDNQRQKNSQDTLKTAFLASEEAPRVGLEPTSQKSQSIDNKALTANTNPVLSTGLDKILQKHPDLAHVIEAWPTLPEAIKAEIKKLISRRV